METGRGQWIGWRSALASLVRVLLWWGRAPVVAWRELSRVQRPMLAQRLAMVAMMEMAKGQAKVELAPLAKRAARRLVRAAAAAIE